MTYYATGGYPELATIRSWIRIATTNLSDPDLAVIAAAEQHGQSQRLDWGAGELPPDALAAFLRRVQRAAFAKTVPHGIVSADAEFGTMRISRWDAEIERYEAPYVLPVIA